RQTIRGGPGIAKRAYSETFQREHRAIVQAIRNRAVLQARAAMRRHLVNSRKRYQRLAAQLGSRSVKFSLSHRNRDPIETVLVTGAAGGIGTRLRQLLKGVYPTLRLSDVKRPADLAADETFIEADLASMAAVETAVAGVDGIVHLGGFSV